jgi:hypothetical protein
MYYGGSEGGDEIEVQNWKSKTKFLGVLLVTKKCDQNQTHRGK